MKILVTGREGQLARALAERSAAVEWLEMECIGRPRFDLERPDTLTAHIERIAPDVIVNAAAYTAVDHAEDNTEVARIVNAEAAGAIAAAARSCGARMIQISTDYVFDGTSDHAYREDAPTNPLGVYGRTKAEGEEWVRAELADHLILRTAWLHSPFGRNFVTNMMRLAEQRDEVSVVADQHGNPTSALDLADGLLAVLERWRHHRTGLGRTYHLAGSGLASWCGFAEAIFERCRAADLPAAKVRPIASSEWPAKAPRPKNSALDCSRFAADFGFQMRPWQGSLDPVIQRLGVSSRAF